MAAGMQSLVAAPTSCRVSSVLERNKRLYGAENMLSSDPTTCWNSAQGSPQQILLQFHRAVCVRSLELMFQGGFVGQDVELLARRSLAGSDAEWETLAGVDVEPEDANDLQRFACIVDDVEALQICFKRSTDFYGRVIVYRLDVLGLDAALE